ncbi:MAG TPA: ABC transporter permease subunit [Chloroflexota bacterium]|nr:ABC transporter permease subunit [Chloroflexota bacterium]
MRAVDLQEEKDKKDKGGGGSLTASGLALRLLGLMIFDAGAFWMILTMWGDGYWQFAAVIAFITVLINYIWLRPEAYPLRWMSPGLAFMILISVYPIIYTVYISFTNYGTGHLLPKVQAIEVLEQRRYLPESGLAYNFTLYQNANGDFALLLTPEGNREAEPIVVIPGEDIEEPELGPLAEDGLPVNIVIPDVDAPYERVARAVILRALSDLQQTTFGGEEVAVQIRGIDRAAALQQRYTYNEETDTITDNQTGVIYIGDDQRGEFISAEGQALIPGYTVPIGFRNYQRFLGNPAFRGPLVMIFAWTVTFALFSTVLSFALGLMIALVFGRNMPGQKVIKSLLIIPFAIPGVLTILVWRGLWNPVNGIVGIWLSELMGTQINVFADSFWVKVALIIINVWLAYPYYVLINSGALQAIPQDMYEAADIDGANAWHQFRALTLPLLLVGVGPLIIGSFLVNFNSFNLIYLFNNGGPPIVGTPTPAGHSDILISYVYRLAFASAGQDFGYASAITVIIFFILATITLFQYRFMRTWEKVGESV